MTDPLDDAWTPIARLDWHLDNWRAYRLGSDDQVAYGAPSRAAGCVGGGYVSDSESPFLLADVAAAEKTQGCIDSLPDTPRSAIERRYLGSAYRGQERYDRALEDARVRLLALFRLRGVL